MKITLCGSTTFMDEMLQVSIELSQLGNRVKIPSINLRDPEGNKYPTTEFREDKLNASDDAHVWDVIHLAIQDHFEKVEWSDAILVCNYNKNEVDNYVGPNTLMEMGLALHLNKKIFLLNPIPDLSWKEEILGIQPIVINGDLKKIK